MPGITICSSTERERFLRSKIHIKSQQWIEKILCGISKNKFKFLKIALVNGEYSSEEFAEQYYAWINMYLYIMKVIKKGTRVLLFPML